MYSQKIAIRFNSIDVPEMMMGDIVQALHNTVNASD